MKQWGIMVLAMCLLAAPAFAGEKLKLNPKLDYSSDSQDGPLISGENMDAGFTGGKPAYVIMYGEGCYNSKRQARRTVGLYEKYQGRVQFVIIDIDHRLSSAQTELTEKAFSCYSPHGVGLDAAGAPVYNNSGEVDDSVISGLLDKTLR